MFYQKRVDELKERIALCESFISRGIDVDYYENQKKLYKSRLESLKVKIKIFKKAVSVIVFIVLFITLFSMVYYILKQFF